MKFKNVNLEWYAIRHCFNDDELEYINVLDDRFVEDITKCLKSKDSYYKIDTKEQLKERIKKHLMWRFWGKCEQEVLIQGLFAKNNKVFKRDVWYQLEPNIDRIVEYVSSEMKIEFDKKGNII